jgi:thiol-disulfide isomerase/thioredoxin
MVFLWLVLALAAAKIDFYDSTQDLDDGNWFVMYFAPWCAHCQEVEPEFGEAGSRHPADFILVDCQEYKVLCRQRAITRYPSFVYYEDGLNYPYEGGRTTHEFTEFVSKVSGPALYELETLDKFLGYYEVSFTLLYDSEDLRTLFLGVAEDNKHTHMHFAALKSDRAELLATGKDFREHFSSAALKLRDIKEFVALHSLPTVASMEPSALPKVTAYSRDKELLVLVADLSDQGHLAVVPVFTSAALKLRRNRVDIQACILDASKQGEQVEIYELETLPALIKTRLQSTPPQAAIELRTLTQALIEEMALERPMEEVSPSLKFRFKKMFGYLLSWQFLQNNSGWFVLIGLVLVVCLVVSYMVGGEEEEKADKED